MKYLALVCLIIVSYSNAQYEQQPEEPVGEGNAYYDPEGAGHEPQQHHEPPPPEHAEHHPQPQQYHQEPPPQQYHQEPPRQQYRQQYARQNENLGAENENKIKSNVPIQNGSFSLPAYYESVTTTERVVKINRRTYSQMIDILIRDEALKTPRLIEAFSKVDRGYFVHQLEDEPYGFMVRKLGRGVFLEKPHFQAKILELLASHIKEGSRVLDVGSGTGFMSCVMAELAGKTGKVFALEHIKEHCEEAWDNIGKVRSDLINDGRLHIRCRDGRAGLLAHGPYDVIFFSPYVPDIPHAVLIQLKPGGRLVCGVGKTRVFHRVVVVDRSLDGKTFTKYDAGSENFINPLINANDQNDNWLYQQSRRRIIEAKGQGLSGIQLARKLKLFTKKSVDFRKLDDDTFKFIEF